ncbi:MAG: TrbC/VirB2 family protein [Candidatus Binataceae bacterium]
MKPFAKIRRHTRKWAAHLSYAIGIATILWPAQVFAAVAGGGALPWDTPLTTLQTDLQGPVAHTITTAAIIGTGLMWSVSEHGTGVRKMSAVAFGGAAALGATTLMTSLFPLGGALF